MTRKIMIVFMATLLITACQKEVPVPISIQLGTVQTEIKGNCAKLVITDTSGMVFTRDSVADEKVDTVYDIHTTLVLQLDSTFQADKMEGNLQLELLNDAGETIISAAPVDDATPDSLIAFMKKDIGEKMEIAFAGKAGKSKFLMIPKISKVLLSGFSFHELDPESLADPTITALIDKFEQLAIELNKDVKEYGWIGGGPAEEIGNMEQQLKKLKPQMSPKQLERFIYVTNHYQTRF